MPRGGMRKPFRRSTIPRSPKPRGRPDRNWLERLVTPGSVSALPAIGIPRVDSGRDIHLPSARIEELMELASTDERSSLDTILSELTNRDAEIRKAALEATVQFGSRDAIPKLMDVVGQVDEPQEKADILEAIEFLKLPSATELAQVRRPNALGKRAITQQKTP